MHQDHLLHFICIVHVLTPALVFLQLLGFALASCQAPEGGTASGQDAENSSLGTKLPRQALGVVLQLLALHSALQATIKTGIWIYCQHLTDLHDDV